VAARHPGKFVLAADTVVAAGRRILPKAEDERTARRCLSLLSGRRHRVHGGVALLTPRQIRRLGVLGFCGCVLLLVAVLFVGPEVKGATRWLNIAGISVQPSEFTTPTFAIISAWMFAESRLNPGFPGKAVRGA